MDWRWADDSHLWLLDQPAIYGRVPEARLRADFWTELARYFAPRGYERMPGPRRLAFLFQAAGRAFDGMYREVGPFVQSSATWAYAA